jgi:hypothetical protein
MGGAEALFFYSPQTCFQSLFADLKLAKFFTPFPPIKFRIR